MGNVHRDTSWRARCTNWHVECGERFAHGDVVPTGFERCNSLGLHRFLRHGVYDVPIECSVKSFDNVLYLQRTYQWHFVLRDGNCTELGGFVIELADVRHPSECTFTSHVTYGNNVSDRFWYVGIARFKQRHRYRR